MPTYAFRRGDNGEVEWVFLTVAQLGEKTQVEGDERFILGDDGVRMFREYDLEWKGGSSASNVDPWVDHASDAAGVGLDQVPEAMEADRRMGVPTRYDSLGRPQFTSANHQKKWLKKHGMVNKDSGY